MASAAAPVLETRVAATRRPPWLILLPAALVAGVVFLPLAYLLFRSFGASEEAWRLLLRARTLEVLARSVVLAVAVTGCSIAIALPVAWLTVRADLPFKRALAVLTALPLAIPSYVGGFLMVVALGPKGMLQQLLAPMGVDRLPEIYGFPGAMLTLTLLSYPYVLLSVRSALWGLDPSIEEVSRGLGESAWGTFWRVTLPRLRPAIAAGALLVALYTLSDFGAVSLLRYETFTWAIYLQYETAFNREAASVLSLVLVALALGILIFEGRTRAGLSYYRTGSGTARPPAPVHLGQWRWVAFALCSALVTFTLVLPTAMLAYVVIKGAWMGEQFMPMWAPAFNSVFVSSVAALVGVAAAVPVAVMAARYPGGITAWLERLSFVGFALPGIVVALSLVFLASSFAWPIYQTLALLVLAYAILFLPAAMGSIKASLLQVSPRLEEAARTLGRGPSQAFATVTLPLVRPGVMAAAGLVFLLTMKELPATLILGPIGFKTLATSTWSAASEAFLVQAAAPAVLLVLVSLVPMGFLLKWERASR